MPWEQFFRFFLCLSLTSNLHRLCHGSSSPPTTSTSLRACVSTNLRQYCSPAPRNGLYAHKLISFEIPRFRILSHTGQSIWPNMISTRCVHSALRRDLQRSANSWCRGFVAFGAPAFYAGCIFFCHQVFDTCPISVSTILTPHCSTTRPSRHASLFKSWECIPRCFPLLEEATLRSGM